MALREFHVRSLDAVLSGEGEAADLDVEVTGILDATIGKKLFLGRDPRTVAAREGFEQVVAEVDGAPLATVVLSDVVVLGRGLLVEPSTQTVWAGESIGWSDDSIAMDFSALFGRSWSPGESVWIDDEQLVAAETIDEAMLLTQPGIGVYGHWLIDVLPRLQTWRTHHRDLPLLVGQTEDWAYYFAARFGADLSTSPVVRPHRSVRVGCLVVPTLTKRKQALDRHRTASAWAEFAEALTALPSRRRLPGGERIYVSRANWSRGRRLLNESEVEQRVAQHGFVVVRPEDYKLRQQVRIFREARHVVGVDGSGLHNVLFAPSGAVLSVIDMHRINLWHAGVANVGDQHVSHLCADEVPGQGWYLPVDVLDQHLEEIVAATVPWPRRLLSRKGGALRGARNR